MRRTAALLLVAVCLAGCSDSPDEVRADYCQVVREHQGRLSEIMAEDSPTTLLRALPVFRELAAQAPRDIDDDWTRVIDALSGLDRALDDAGIEPGAYDARQPPTDVTKAEQRAIARAADEVGTQEVADALEGVQQQARDVCKTPLYR